jgi:hypothetical protein
LINSDEEHFILADLELILFENKKVSLLLLSDKKKAKINVQGSLGEVLNTINAFNEKMKFYEEKTLCRGFEENPWEGETPWAEGTKFRVLCGELSNISKLPI